MNESRIYKVNLRGFDLSSYSGVVTENFGKSLDHLVGRAEVLPGKCRVRIEFRNGAPEYPHWVSVGYVCELSGSNRRLMELSIITGKEPSAYMKRKIRKSLEMPEAVKKMKEMR